jgi:hypothetical protein
VLADSVKKKKRNKNYTKEKSCQAREEPGANDWRRKMEVAAYILAAFSAIGFVLVGIIYSSHKALGIWVFFVSCVLALLGACLYWQKSVNLESENAPFAAGIQRVFLCVSGHGFWVAYQSQHGDTVGPVDMCCISQLPTCKTLKAP